MQSLRDCFRAENGVRDDDRQRIFLFIDCPLLQLVMVRKPFSPQPSASTPTSLNSVGIFCPIERSRIAKDLARKAINRRAKDRVPGERHNHLEDRLRSGNGERGLDATPVVK